MQTQNSKFKRKSTDIVVYTRVNKVAIDNNFFKIYTYT